MARPSVKTIVNRDFDRLEDVKQKKDIHQALDHIVDTVRNKVSIISLPKLRGFLGRKKIEDRFSDDLYERFLDRLHISESQWAHIESLSHKWALLYDNPGLEYHVRPLIQEISDFIGFQVQSYPLREGNLWDFSLLFPDVHFNYFDEEVHLIVVTDSRSGPNEFTAIKSVIRENRATMKVTLVLVLGNGDTLREMAKESSIEIVILDEDDCRAILLSPNAPQTFCHRVAGRVSVKALQPYQTQGKVRDRMFYGRRDEIRRVRNNLSSSFAIYGGRLVGKSSLLHRIGAEFDVEDGYQVCSITAQGLTSSVEVCRAILKGLQIPTARHRSVLTFERLVRDYLVGYSKRTLILVDEVDDLIGLDEEEGFQMLEAFHNLNSDYGERCRFIFAGYRDLARHCMDSTSRFRNFAEPIRLGNLDPPSARRLIEEPMLEELGFRFESDSLVEEILEMTAGHPNYIQVFCKELTEHLERQQRRRVRQDDIEYIFQNPDFRGRVVETFYINFSSLQQLIVALILLEELDNFSLTKVLELLAEYGVNGVELADTYKELRQLEMSFVIEQRGIQYRFIHQLFPQMLRQSVNLESLAFHLLDREGEKWQS